MVEEFLPSTPTLRPRRKFLPRDRIEALINREKVEEELLRNAPNIPCVIRNMYTEAVYSSRRKIFATLVLIDQTSLISGFMGDDLTDSILPISVRGNIARPRAGLREKEIIHCFTGLPSSVLDAFQSTQWMLLAPTFGQRSNDIQKLDLDPESILPFIAGPVSGNSTSIVRGGFSSIAKVKISNAHLEPQAQKVFQGPPFMKAG